MLKMVIECLLASPIPSLAHFLLFPTPPKRSKIILTLGVQPIVRNIIPCHGLRIFFEKNGTCFLKQKMNLNSKPQNTNDTLKTISQNQGKLEILTS